MKQYIYILILLLNFLFSPGQNTNDWLGIGDNLTFSSESYHLSRSEKPYNNYFVQEYIRPHENFNTFSKSIIVMTIVDTTSADQLITLKIEELEKIKHNNKNIKYQVLLNDEGGRMIEFSIYNDNYYFWNIQRYEIQVLPNQQMAGVIYTYIERINLNTGLDIKNIKESIKRKRINFINEVGSIKLPEIKLKSTD